MSRGGQTAEEHALDHLTGRTFDRAYLKGQLKAHQDTVALLEGEIQNSSDQIIKTMAADILPTVREHLSMLKQMAM